MYKRNKTCTFKPYSDIRILGTTIMARRRRGSRKGKRSGGGGGRRKGRTGGRRVGRRRAGRGHRHGGARGRRLGAMANMYPYGLA